MNVRRVVTGHKEGRAVVASDTELAGVQPALLPGFEFHWLWGSDGPAVYPDDGSPQPQNGWFPPLTGFRFVVVTLPPDGPPPVGIDEEAAVEEIERLLPGLLGTLEPDHPGMHTTDTTDCLYILSGEIVLELDDGVEVELSAGDTVVQSGTRHAWHNRSDRPCTIVAVQVGARRMPSP
jgi:mannose-6-phosphate isomerase-like protein (cupin superfamily)